MNINKYFIKDCYVENLDARTFELESKGEYWTNNRIETSKKFQYDVYVKAVEFATKNNSKTIVDLGSGPGTKIKMLFDTNKYEITFIDQPNCQYIINKNFPSSKFIPVNLESIDNKLALKADLIICADVIEHLHNPSALLNFIKNSLAENGIAFISTPERDILRGKHCIRSHHDAHVREWNAIELKRLLTYFDFRIEGHFLLPPQKLFGLKKIEYYLFNRFFQKPEWHSCQLFIVRN